MLRPSRFAVLAFILFFFPVALVGAYVHCFEAWPQFEDRFGTAKYTIQNSNSEDEVLRCPDERKPYRLIQAQRTAKKDPRSEWAKANRPQSLSSVASGHTNLARYSAQPFASLLPLFPYPSIAIYQAKVVYRI